MEYTRITTRLVGAAFVAGPLLLVVSAVVLLADVGRGPGAASYGSSVEGIIGFFGFLMLLPAFVTLAGRIGRTRPRLGAVAAVMSLMGVAGAMVTMTLRVATGALVEVGVTAATFDALQADLEAGQSILMWLLWAGPVCPLAAIVLGVGLRRTGHPRRQAWLLVAGGVLLPMGQLLLIATDLTYSAALVLWAVALVPDGLRLSSGSPEMTLRGHTPVQVG